MLLVINILAGLDQALQRDVQTLPELADHFQRKGAFVVQHLGDAATVSDIGFQVLAPQSSLFHAEQDRFNWIRRGNGMMPGLISLDQRDKDVQLIAIGSIGFGSP